MIRSDGESARLAMPRPGDLILVNRSYWYALRDGDRLRVCESAGWAVEGEEIFVAPRQQVSTFWGPCHGPPDGDKRESMSTSGGPFLTLKLRDLSGLEPIGKQRDTFWCWQDRPRAGGGIDRVVEVEVWRLPILRDPHE